MTTPHSMAPAAPIKAMPHARQWAILGVLGAVALALMIG